MFEVRSGTVGFFRYFRVFASFWLSRFSLCSFVSWSHPLRHFERSEKSAFSMSEVRCLKSDPAL